MEGNGGNKMLEVLLGQIPEAIYFALFMIFVKQLKEKSILFIILMIAEYLLLKVFIKYNMWFQILYTFMTFLILKLLYKGAVLDDSKTLEDYKIEEGFTIIMMNPKAKAKNVQPQPESTETKPKEENKEKKEEKKEEKKPEPWYPRRHRLK